MTNPGQTTRPITDRVKECLFERMEARCVGSRIADIFAGTGTIGLEAMSRGGTSAVFIEKDRKAVELLRSNIEMLGCQDESLVWPADVWRCSFRPKGRRAEQFSPYDLMFCDPPYKMIPSLVADSPLWLALRRLARGDVSTPNATLILRAPERARFELPDDWEPEWDLSLSNMVIFVCRKSARSEASPAPDDEEE